MTESSKPQLSITTGANRLHGVLRADRIRLDTLTQLVTGWDDDKTREEIIAALDELAAVVGSVAREGELDAAVEQVEDVAGMDTAQVEVAVPDVRRLLAEVTVVERVTSRFQQGASEIKHPSHAATRRHFKAQPLPGQREAGAA
jgi:hypothetical protein